jgi:hypothetical protein
MLDIHGVFLYSNHMTNLARQIQLKLRKVNELIIELKVKYLDESRVYSDINKIDERLVELDKLIDNSK